MTQPTQSLLQRFAKTWDLHNGESGIRSLVKAYSYRMCGTATTIVISYFITGKIIVSLAIGTTEIVVKPFIYWCHERVWNKLTWGKTSSTL